MTTKKQHLMAAFLLIFLTTNVKSTTIETSSALSTQEVENSDLRKGFQFVYSIANTFIDFIEINLPDEIFSSSNESTIKYTEFTDNLSNYFSSNWKSYSKKVIVLSPFKFYLTNCFILFFRHIILAQACLSS
jgi:hypothetical protein